MSVTKGLQGISREILSLKDFYEKSLCDSVLKGFLCDEFICDYFVISISHFIFCFKLIVLFGNLCDFI